LATPQASRLDIDQYLRERIHSLKANTAVRQFGNTAL